MSLGLAYEIARGGLVANSVSSSVVSRNIANVDNPNGARKTANVVTSANGGVNVDSITSAIDAALFETVVGSSSKVGELSTISSALTELEAAIQDPQSGLSANGVIGQLKSALQVAASAPQDDNLTRSLLAVAQTVTSSLNQAGALVDKVRAGADVDLVKGAGQLTNLLASFETVNNEVVTGVTLGRDVTDQIDKRNALLGQISYLVDVHSTVRGAQDMVLFVANGTTLFESVPRKITVDAGVPLQPGQPGGALRIDGIPFTGVQGAKLGGTLGGALQVRDIIAPLFGRQIDEVARGLIETFAESDQSPAASAPSLAGLFTYSGGPALPAAGVVVPGLARSIKVNPNGDPAQGGDLARLRDGNLSAPGNPSYNYNPSGAAGFGDRLRSLVSDLASTRSFDAAARLGTDKNLLQFAGDSAGWLESQRATALDELQQKQVLSERAAGAWHSAVGVNLDEELTTLMSLERSFQASSRIISTVSGMFDALLQMVK